MRTQGRTALLLEHTELEHDERKGGEMSGGVQGGQRFSMPVSGRRATAPLAPACCLDLHID